jgi:serine/threonine protein kinase
VVQNESKSIGKYRVLRELGRGGMGVVYLAEDTSLDREVALKSILGSLAENDALLRRFEAEARAVGKLFHPHIIPINALMRENGALYIEMPYLEGGSLGALLEKRQLPCPDIVRFCADILDALAACHEEGIVHRDVKPNNILLDGRDRTLLGDFGLAKVVGEEMSAQSSAYNSSSMFVGTPRYAPLEAWDEENPTPAWDLFSIGVILFEGLAGRPVHEVNSPLAHVRALERTPAPSLSRLCPGISDSLSDLVASLLEISPERRLSDARAARDVLVHTPEYGALGDPTSAAITVVQKKARSRVQKLGASATPSYALWACVGLIVLVGIFGFLSYTTWFSESSPHGDTRVSQDAARTLPAYSVGNILSSWRFSDSGQAKVFSKIGTPSEGGSPEKWLLLKNQKGTGHRVLARTQSRVALLTFTPDGKDTFQIDGIWGEYLDGIVHECANGRVVGHGWWIGENEGVYCELDYSAARQGMQWSDRIALEAVSETDTEFLWKLEENSLQQRLIQRELAPREAKWKELYPVFLPAIHANYKEAHPLENGTETITIDGALNDWPWGVQGADGVPGWPSLLNPSLCVAFSGEGLFFALAVDELFSQPEMEIVLQPVLPLYAGAASQSHVVFSEKGIQGAKRAGGDYLRAYKANCLFSEVSNGNEWRCEIFIPFSSLHETEGFAPPMSYRVNLAVRELLPETASPKQVQWGAPELFDTAHGVVVHLPPNETNGTEE